MDQDPLLLVFLDLLKAYNTVDCGHLMMMLEGYNPGPCMFRLLALFWYQQEVVTCQNGYHGLHFRATWGTTQRGLISPNLFNEII